MAKLIEQCSYCQKPLELVSSAQVNELESVDSYKCGHSYFRKGSPRKVLTLNAVTGDKKAREYQQAGIDFIVNGQGERKTFGNCIVADQMRLGKTPQALLALATNYKEQTPALILVRSANLWQWIHEYKTWCDSLPLGIYPIIGTKAFIPPGFSAYIMSMDTFSRGGNCKNCKHPVQSHNEITDKCSKKGCDCRRCLEDESAMSNRLLDFGFKTCIVDEAHCFKNTESNRSQALLRFLKRINTQELKQDINFNCPFCKETWVESITISVSVENAAKRTSKTSHCPKCKATVQQSAAAHIKVERHCSTILLTGTAIKNRADEYFVPLNIVAPQRFPSLASFRSQWLCLDSNGRYSRIAPYRMEEFKRVIAPYVLRREKEDVYDNLPPLNRMYTVITVDDERLKKAYNTVLDTLEAEMVRNPNLTFFQSIGELTMLRQIAAMAKVNWVADYVETMLLDDPNRKVAIGLHHISVRDALKYQLSQFGVMTFDGTDNAETKYEKQIKFAKSPEKVLAINMLAGGVGCDFHYINDVVVLERQWNQADESQFEFRFYNPDRSIKTESTDVEYVLAKGTIDEWFHDHVEETHKIFGETCSNNYSLDDAASFKALLEKTVSHRL